MRRTIRWPPRIVGGRVVMTADPEVEDSDPNEALIQTMALGLLPGTSTNPWNDRDRIGVDDQTFSAVDGPQRRIRRALVERRFRLLERERRAKLVSVQESTRSGETVVRIEYDNLETGERVATEVR